MAEQNIFGMILSNLWAPWIYVLLKLGGAEAVALAVPVTLSMLILGAITYFLLKFIVLAKIIQHAGGGSEDGATNGLVLIITLAVTFISLYSGAALFLAGMLQTFGIVYAFILFLVLMLGLIFVAWNWGKGLRSELRGEGGGMGDRISNWFGRRGSMGARALRRDTAKETAETEHDVADAVRDLNILEDTIRHEHDAFVRMHQLVSNNPSFFTSRDNLKKTINYLNQLKGLAKEKAVEKNLLRKINELNADLNQLKGDLPLLKNASRYTKANAKSAGYTPAQFNILNREILIAIDYIKNKLPAIENTINQIEKNIIMHVRRKDKMLAELTILLSKRNIRLNMPKIKDILMALITETNPNGPLMGNLVAEEAGLKKYGNEFMNYKQLIDKITKLEQIINAKTKQIKNQTKKKKK